MKKFIDFCNLCEKLAKITERIPKIRLIAKFLRELDEEEITPAARMLIGKVLPDWSELTLGLSWTSIIKVVKKLTGAKSRDLLEAFSKTGDPGDMARILFEKYRRRQATLIEITQEQLSILDVYKELLKIAQIRGEGSTLKKEIILTGLLNKLSPLEIKYVIKIILGEMRIGVQEGTVEMAIAEAARVPLELIRRANMFLADIGETAKLALTRGERGLKEVKVQLFRPYKPMLADQVSSVSEALAEHGVSAFEFKLDGARVQIHKKENQVKIFSRRLTDVTESLPDVVEEVITKVKATEVILEGEVIAVNEEGKPLPFQYLVRRFRRVRDVQRLVKEIPVKLYVFDVLYLNGKELFDEPYEKRWEYLEKICPKEMLVPRIITKNPEEAENFLKEAKMNGHEGLMAKRLTSPYIPGRREKHWLKIKPYYTLDLVIVAADWGYGRRKNWLSDYYLAARDEETGRYLIVGKTFKGLTDAELADMTKKLLALKIKEVGRTVYVQPKIVVEVAFDEIQKSPKWESGYALRFARILRIRWDKSPEEADTISKIRELYQKQFEMKGSII